jgi:hypothetical protein
MKRHIARLSCLTFLSSVKGSTGSISETVIGAINNIASEALEMTSSPSSKPSQTHMPSFLPSLHPSNEPTIYPSNEPSLSPSQFPTSSPSGVPSLYPTNIPSFQPSLSPSSNPSYLPTSSKSSSPTLISQAPSMKPSIGNNNFNRNVNSSTKEVPHKSDQSQSATFVMMVSCIAGFAVFTVLGVLYIIRRNRSQNFNEVRSVKGDSFTMPKREPEPLPATRSILRQISNRLPSQVRKKSAENHQSEPEPDDTSTLGGGFSHGDGDISLFDPSTIQTEKTSVWGRRLERDTSYDIESKPSSLSDFVLPSVFDPSTIRTEGSMAKRTAFSKNFEGLQFFNDEPIPDQIFCIDEEE